MRLPVADTNGRTADCGVRRHSPFDCGRIDKRLKARARLSISLGGVIEFVCIEIVTSYHGYDFAGLCIERHHRSLHRGNLREFNFQAAVLLVYLFNSEFRELTNLKLVLWLAMRPAHIRRCQRGGEISEAHSSLILYAVNLHDQSDQVALRLIIVSVPVWILVAIQFLLSRWPLAVFHRGLNHCVARTPTAVRLVVLTETGTDHVISALLSFGVDGGVDRQTALSNSSRVLIFKFLANVLDRIIKR